MGRHFVARDPREEETRKRIPRLPELRRGGRARIEVLCELRARLGDSVSLREERKLVSIVFVDLVDFTRRSDRADPEDVRETLQLYHAEARRRIEHYGGVVEKFIGDAVVAVLGARPHTATTPSGRYARVSACSRASTS
jgi:class 3 adenylate cyclase